MKNRRSGGAFVLVLVTLLLCACVTMGLAVFIMKEKTAHYKVLVPRLKVEYEKIKAEKNDLKKEDLDRVTKLARENRLLAGENSELKIKLANAEKALEETNKK
ncbi:MAG: hypothetical protein ACYS8W_16240 [Planctomycetota bacterium]